MRIVRYIDVYPWSSESPENLYVQTEGSLRGIAEHARRYRITIDIPDLKVDGEILAGVERIGDGQTQG